MTEQIILPLVVIIILIKLFVYTPSNKNESHLRKIYFSRFIMLFLLIPANYNKANYWGILSRCFTKQLIWIKIYISRYKSNLLNFLRKTHFPKIYIWRPLFKKSSYYGLYVQARTNFIKIFKN